MHLIRLVIQVTLFVARCLANGYGTKKDLNGALCYYGDYVRISGCSEDLKKEIDKVKRELGDIE